MIWGDAQLSPELAVWLEHELGHPARSVRELGLRDATDIEIYNAAKKAKALLLSKDSDFVELVLRQGAPPQLLWVTCGNTSNIVLKRILKEHLRNALNLLDAGEIIVEIRG
jgi:predicted nuclease of predicted toxin-antitoxin system